MKKLYSIASISAVVILFLILVSSTASASITEKWITNHGTASLPAIYGNTIVWQDERNGNSDIYIYDLSTKKETHTTNLSNQTYPAIYGNKVVWADDRNGGSDIYMYDISTKKETRITSKGKAFSPDIYGNKKRKAFSPDIYGNQIVWQDNRGVSRTRTVIITMIFTCTIFPLRRKPRSPTVEKQTALPYMVTG